MSDFLQRPVAAEALAEPSSARREAQAPSLELLRSWLAQEVQGSEAEAVGEGSRSDSDTFGQAMFTQAEGDTEREVRNPTFTRNVYEKHAGTIDGTELNLSRYSWSVQRLQEIWAANQARYENVAAQVDLPAELIAALHFRESSGDFNTYLHQGDPLGRPAVNHPSNIPVFHQWEEAAVHALSDGHKAGIQDDLDITQNTEDMAALGSYAEYYNGLGYHNRGRVSPYVYAGTDHYKSGKYVRDGVFDSQAVDRQLGVLAMVQVLNGKADAPLAGPSLQLGDRNLRQGIQGNDVRELQALLNGQGANLQVDGDFGQGTDQAVKAFQRRNGLTADGVVGNTTLAVLRPSAGPQEDAPATTSAASVQEEEPAAATDTSQLDLGTGLLREGSRGDAVRALQQKLVELGQGVAVDGVFGRNTKAAVRWFQRSRGLSVDGVVGAQTRTALQG